MVFIYKVRYWQVWEKVYKIISCHNTVTIGAVVKQIRCLAEQLDYNREREQFFMKRYAQVNADQKHCFNIILDVRY